MINIAELTSYALSSQVLLYLAKSSYSTYAQQRVFCPCSPLHEGMSRNGTITNSEEQTALLCYIPLQDSPSLGFTALNLCCSQIPMAKH